MLVVAVGRILGQPRQQCEDVVFPVYIYLYLYISIYICFSFPSLFQGQYVTAGTSVLSWRIQDEGPFFMVLWLGLDQKRQHLSQRSGFLKPEVGGRGVERRREMQRKEEDKES